MAKINTKLKYVYRVGLFQHLNQGMSVFFVALVFAIFPLVFYYNFGSDSVEFSIKASIFVFLFISIPQLVFHIRYWWLNRNVMLAFNSRSKAIFYKNNKVDIEFHVDDIERIDTYVSRAYFSGNPRFYPVDNYFYSIFDLKNGFSFVITSLLVSELQWPIALPKESRNWKFFCWV